MHQLMQEHGKIDQERVTRKLQYSVAPSEACMNRRPHSRYLSAAAALLFLVVASGGHASAAASETEARALFTKFVAAQNAHNADEVKTMLWNSPSMLLFARGVETRGPEAVAARFKDYYEG